MKMKTILENAVVSNTLSYFSAAIHGRTVPPCANPQNRDRIKFNSHTK